MPSKKRITRKVKLKRARRSYSEMFLDELKAESNGEQKFIPNATIRGNLDWDKEKYNRVKLQLIDEKKIILGSGQGGTVCLASTGSGKAPVVFISYSHADEKLKDELVKHLSPLKRMGLIDTWHDRKIPAGEDIDKEVSKNLDKAQIILLLISVDFISSRYCYEIEMDRALEMNAQGKARVIPVIVRQCMWQHTPFSKLLAVPTDGKAIKSWNDQDEALANAVAQIKSVVEEVINEQE